MGGNLDEVALEIARSRLLHQLGPLEMRTESTMPRAAWVEDEAMEPYGRLFSLIKTSFLVPGSHPPIDSIMAALGCNGRAGSCVLGRR